VRITFLGVGEAFDEELSNTSVLVRTTAGGEPASILLDCGFTVPSPFWRRVPGPQDLDLVWISHFHGDHFFGLPAVLLRFWESGRTKPLVLVGQTGLGDVVRKTMELAYPRFLQKLAYPLQFVEVEPGRIFSWKDLEFSFAENDHGLRDLAVRLDRGGRSVFYSGDGRATEQTLSLAHRCDLVIHESFRWKEPTPGHGTVAESIEFARRAQASRLALVHLQRDERRKKAPHIREALQGLEGLEGILPQAGDEIVLHESSPG